MINKGIQLEEFLAAGGKMPKGARRHIKPEVETLALKVVGLLAKAPDNKARVQVIARVQQMLANTRGR